VPAWACSVSLSLLIMSGMSWPTIGSVSGLAHRTTSLIASNAWACSRVLSPGRAACGAPAAAGRQSCLRHAPAAQLHCVLSLHLDEHEERASVCIVQGCTVSSRAWMMSLK
jgi:hypothetical protein